MISHEELNEDWRDHYTEEELEAHEQSKGDYLTLTQMHLRIIELLKKSNITHYSQFSLWVM